MAKPATLRAIVRARQGSDCCYCGREMGVPRALREKAQPLDETLEHLRRKSEGGTDDLDNLALACNECNVGRGHMDWLTYKSFRMGEFYEFLEAAR